MDGKKTDIINIRISNSIKENSRRVLYKYSLDHSKGIRHFLNYIIEHDALPKEFEDYITEQNEKEAKMKQFK